MCSSNEEVLWHEEEKGWNFGVCREEKKKEWRTNKNQTKSYKTPKKKLKPTADDATSCENEGAKSFGSARE